MKMRRGVLYVVLFLLLVSISYAQAPGNATPVIPPTGSAAGYSWLENVSTTHNSPLSDQALSIIALSGETSRAQTISTLVQKIKEQQDSAKSCWPKTGCTAKDSSLVILALTKTGNTPDKELAALKKQLLATLRTSGEWRIQIDAPSNGTCSITVNGQKKDFTLEGNSITGASRKYYIHVAADLPGGSTLLATPNPKITVDCTSLSGTVTLSLIYAKSTTELYVVQNFPNTAKADMTIQNTCFADRFDGTGCSYSATLETTWALTEAGQSLDQLGTLPYLYSSLSNDDIQRAYLARILTLSSKTPTSLLDLLVKNQRSDGSWKGGDITATSLSLLALQPSAGNYQSPVTNARLFIEKKQSNDGSWKQTIKDTALALIALKGEIRGGTSAALPPPRTATGIEICDNQIDDNKNGLLDCADVNACSKEKICHCENLEKDYDETKVDCGGSTCPACEGTDTSAKEIDEEIIPVKKAFGSCKTDSDCTGGDVCSSGSCTQKESSNTWIFAVIIILIIIGAGAFFYLKYIKTGTIDLRSLFSRKSKKQTFEEFKRMTEFQPITRPPAAKQPQPASAQRKPLQPLRAATSKDDDALDKSLKEAQRILQKK